MEEAMIAFVSMPSAGVFWYEPDEARWIIHPQAKEILAQLHEDRPDTVFIAPSIQNYELLTHINHLGPTYDSWKDRCRMLIDVSDILIVIKSPYWDESVGVKDEIEYAIKNHCKVEYIEWS